MSIRNRSNQFRFRSACTYQFRYVDKITNLNLIMKTFWNQYLIYSYFSQLAFYTELDQLKKWHWIIVLDSLNRNSINFILFYTLIAVTQILNIMSMSIKKWRFHLGFWQIMVSIQHRIKFEISGYQTFLEEGERFWWVKTSFMKVSYQNSYQNSRF